MLYKVQWVLCLVFGVHAQQNVFTSNHLNCLPPPVLQNGTVTISPDKPTYIDGERVNLTCNTFQGYQLFSPISTSTVFEQTCLFGMWVGTTPTCVQSNSNHFPGSNNNPFGGPSFNGNSPNLPQTNLPCNIPRSPANSRIKYFNQITPVYQHGQTLLFDCNINFCSSVQGILRCLNGRWIENVQCVFCKNNNPSGVSPNFPFNGNTPNVFQTNFPCSAPKFLTNSRIRNFDSTTLSYHHGQTLLFDCNSNFCSNEQGTLICSNGRWIQKSECRSCKSAICSWCRNFHNMGFCSCAQSCVFVNNCCPDALRYCIKPRSRKDDDDDDDDDDDSDDSDDDSD